MINLILFHSGSILPNFIEYTFKQIRYFNPDINIYFLTDKHLLNNELYKKYRIEVFNKDDFYSDKIYEFESYFNYDSNNFWTLAATRLIYIENFLFKNNLENVYHFENDILLYYKLSDHHNKFQEFYKNIAITTGGPDKSMTGFMFINKYDSISKLTQFFIDTLKKYGIKGTIDKYHMDMVNEMSLMKVYGMNNGDEYMSNLPILPTGDFSTHFSDFLSLFDPASWGQFVGGTRIEGPGAKPPDHYIGVLLRQNKNWFIDWKIEKGLKTPYLNKDGELIKINNLHIHSKKLSKYVSK